MRYAFHPEALNDLDDFWEFIAEENVAAADRAVAEILERIETLQISLVKVIAVPSSAERPFDS